jgi:DNA-binding NarL/FixJ family response regulator
MTPYTLPELTPAQREVLTLLTKGFTDREIAQMLERSVHTVHMHVGQIYLRLGVNNRVQAAVLATRAGIA